MLLAALPTLLLALSGGVGAPPEAPFAGRRLVVMVEEANFAAWPALEALAREFEAEHPGLAVRLLDQGGAVGQQDKARFLLAGDLQLDVTRIDVTELGAFLAEGALVDLQPFFEEDPTWDPARYFPVVDGLRGPDGHLYGLPSTFTPYVLYCNLDLLAAAGVAPPRAGWTWEDLLDACRRTTRDLDGDGRNDRWGISLTQWLQALAPWIWQAGGELLDPAGERARFATPQVEAAFRFVRTLLHDEGLASFDASFENQLAQGLFQAGRAAFYGPVGYWETYRFKGIDAFRWDVVPLPRGERAATAIAMTGFVVPRTAAEPELAYRFVRRLAGERYQRVLAEIGNGVPALISAARSESFLKPDVPPPSEGVFLDVLPEARFLPPLANWRKIESLCAPELSQLVLDPACDVPAALARMQAKTDAHLARERARAALPPLSGWFVAAAVGLAFLAAVGLYAGARRRDPRPPGHPAEERAALVLLAPWALGFALFFLGPAVVTLVLSAAEWSPLRSFGELRWVGAGNYARLAADGTFRTSLLVTCVYAAVSVPLGLVVALLLALLVRAETTSATALRTVLYLPAVISPVIVAAVWRYLLDADRGLVNDALAQLGLRGPAWLRDSAWVLPSFVLMSLWSVGAQMLVFVAALKAQDPRLIEAARLDGAGPVRRFWHVTLPALTPVVLFNLVIGLVQAFQLFAQPYIMTQGGPGDASRFLVLYLYESGFRHLDMGYASAIAWVLFALLAVLCLLVMASSRRWVHYAVSRP